VSDHCVDYDVSQHCDVSDVSDHYDNCDANKGLPDAAMQVNWPVMLDIRVMQLKME
jgi:hypothetical protein